MRLVRQSRIRKLQIEYGEGHILQLLQGNGYFGEPHDFGRADDLASEEFIAMREAWQELRTEQMAKWIVDHPFTRPFAWWKFDAPEYRWRIDGPPHPFEHPDWLASVATTEAQYPGFRERAMSLYFGRPAITAIPGDFGAKYESDFDYLMRLDLLTLQERTLIASRQKTES